MNKKMGKKIITISREFGSGGRSIGKAIAQRLGSPYYDKELVKQVAQETGFDRNFIENEGEYASSNNPLSYLFAVPGTPDIMGGMSAPDYLWVVQRQVILNLAQRAPCVIVGRCADFILRDRTDCLNVYIHASEEYRAERIVRLYGETEVAPEKRLQDKDGRRRANYKHFTGREWGRCQNYHLALDSGVIGIERCVDVIAELAEQADNKL